MDWFLYDRDLRHERVKARYLSERVTEIFEKHVSISQRHI